MGFLATFTAVGPPAPYGAVPTVRQLAGQEIELYGSLNLPVSAGTDFDADQIARVFRVGGLQGLILSRFPENSSGKENKGDIVRDVADACRRHGLKFGVALSSGNPQRELLTAYGPIFEVWCEGVNDSTRDVWDETCKLIRRLQPNACIGSDIGPDRRWTDSAAVDAIGETCRAALDPQPFLPPPQQLFNLYLASVGRGASLQLSLAPDHRGRLPDTDAAALRGFHRLLDATFGHDFARGAVVTASNTRGGSALYSRWNATDGRRDTYWSTDDGVTAAELILDLREQSTFNIVRLREYPPLGRRVDAFGLDRWEDGRWIEFGWGASIGRCRLVRGGSVTTSRVRLRVTGPVCPALLELSLFAEPTGS